MLDIGVPLGILHLGLHRTGASEQWEAVSTVPLSAGVKPLLEPASLQRPGPATAGFLSREAASCGRPRFPSCLRVRHCHWRLPMAGTVKTVPSLSLEWTVTVEVCEVHEHQDFLWEAFYPRLRTVQKASGGIQHIPGCLACTAFKGSQTQYLKNQKFHINFEFLGTLGKSANFWQHWPRFYVQPNLSGSE